MTTLCNLIWLILFPYLFFFLLSSTDKEDAKEDSCSDDCDDDDSNENGLNSLYSVGENNPGDSQAKHYDSSNLVLNPD